MCRFAHIAHPRLFVGECARYGGGTSQAAGGLSPIGAGGSLDTAVTGEGLGSSLFGSNGGRAAVPGLSETRGSLGGASGVGINAGGSIGIGGR